MGIRLDRFTVGARAGAGAFAAVPLMARSASIVSKASRLGSGFVRARGMYAVDTQLLSHIRITTISMDGGPNRFHPLPKTLVYVALYAGTTGDVTLVGRDKGGNDWELGYLSGTPTPSLIPNGAGNFYLRCNSGGSGIKVSVLELLPVTDNPEWS